jgi:lysophospholipase L1-like esterase
MRGARCFLCVGLLAGALDLPAQARVQKIEAIGDSITQGLTHSGSGTVKAQFDSKGGYPGRLQAELGDRVEVVGRGFGGSTTTLWLDVPRATPEQVRRFLEANWSSFHPKGPPIEGQSPIDYILDVDRPEVVLLFIGVNDLTTAGGKDVDPGKIAERVATLARIARKKPYVRAVLVATLLPNRRDPADALAETNRRICALEPRCVRLDEAFVAAGGERLLGDEIHPKEEAYAVIAATFARALRDRGLVAPASAAPATRVGTPPSATPAPSAAH